MVRGSLSAREARGIADAISANLEALGPNAGAHGPVSDDPNHAIINGHIFGNITMRTLITYPFQVPSRELHAALQDDLNINKQRV